MSLIARMGGAWRALKGTPPYGSLTPYLERLISGQESKAGNRVDAGTAMQSVCVLGIMRVLCDGMAQAPLKIYRSTADGRGANPAPDHPLYELLYRKPNDWQTSFAFRETMVLHLELTGNFFALLNRVGRSGTIKEIWPIEPGRVQIQRNSDMSLQYFVTGDDGSRYEVPAANIWHVRGPSWRGWIGLEPVRLARDAIGLSMAIEGDQASLYKNGLRTTGTYSVDGLLSQAQYDALRGWIKKHAAENPGEPLILDRAAKFISNTMTSVDAQTLESRKFQVEEICRAFRVIPMMVGYSDKTATYASAEQMFIAHAVHTLAPRFERIEQAIYKDLLTDSDRAAGYYAKFSMNSLMRGSAQERAEYYSKALGSGGSPAWMTQNEVRALEEMNPLDGGDELPHPPKPAQDNGGQNGQN